MMSQFTFAAAVVPPALLADGVGVGLGLSEGLALAPSAAGFSDAA
jgi:hypothetical protein